MNLAKKHKAELHICEPIFIETAVMLKNYYKYNREKVFSLLSDLLAATDLAIENRDRLIQATSLYRETSIDFPDCILIIHARINQLKVLTFDEKVKNIAVS